MNNLNMSTRDRLLDQAESLFAEKGFYGASINEVAKSLGLTKQGLLHYFPTKEKLYAEVLKQAAAYLNDQIDLAVQESSDPAQQMLNFANSISPGDERMFRVTRLFVREVLDNIHRAEEAHLWVMPPLLEKLEAIIIHGQETGKFKPVDPLAFVYTLVGAQQYFVVSQPTLKSILSEEQYKAQLESHRTEVRRIVESTLLV